MSPTARSTDKKVRHHDHLTGKYRGAAPKACNLNYHTHSIFCLISKLFTLGKLILDSAIFDAIFK